MPDTAKGRERIKEYLKANGISISKLATMYDLPRQDMADYLAGRKKNPKANQTILRIISDFDP